MREQDTEDEKEKNQDFRFLIRTLLLLQAHLKLHYGARHAGENRAVRELLQDISARLQEDLSAEVEARLEAIERGKTEGIIHFCYPIRCRGEEPTTCLKKHARLSSLG